MSAQVAVEVIEASPVTVEVVEDGGVLVVEIDRPSEAEVIELIHPGPQGPASAFYVHTQSVASDTWLINHNLGFRPIVNVFDSGSQEVEAHVSHPSVTTTIIVFAIPIAGFARLT
jgi:hypothetical protein